MKNAIGWFDIYVEKMARAVSFYEMVFNLKLEKIDDPTGETQMMSFPANMSDYGAGGALVQSSKCSPGIGGTLVYSGVDNCSLEESRVVDAGGKVVRSKHSIGKFGWVCLCEDTEGNLFGLNSLE